MSVKATDTCTLAVEVDVQKVDTWYKQTASTASAPSKPTTATPSGWQTTEYAFDASKAIWTCQKTTLTDGTFYWGDVSKSSSYEGAIVSYNEAQSAKQTATSYIFKKTNQDAWVCDENAGPNTSTGEAYGPDAANPTTGWRIGSVFQLIRGGIDWFKLWLEESTNKIKLRLGREDSGHVVLDDSGMEVFDYDSTAQDAVSVAEFGKNGARIGKAYVSGATDNESHMELDYHSMQFIDKANNKYFHVSDLRDSSNVASTMYTERIFTSPSTINLVMYIPYSITSITVRNQIASPDDITSQCIITESESSVIIEAPSGYYIHPSYGLLVTIELNTGTSYAKALTFGTRAVSSGTYTGLQSSCFGHDNEARGLSAFAAGRWTHANGYASAAFNNTAAAYGDNSAAFNLNTSARANNQTVIGKYNEFDVWGDGTYAFIIGNGSSSSARSNALAVDWNGNVLIAGGVKNMSGTQLYLPLSGGKMTGRLAFNDGTAIPNASTSTDFFAVGFRAFANGGGVWYKGADDFKSWLAPGSLYSKNTATGFDRDGANPSAALYGEGLIIQDKDGERVGFIRANRLTDGTMQMQLTVANDNTSGTEVSNHLILGVNRSGTRTVSFAESAPWRTALGILRYGRLVGQSSNITLTTSAQKIPFNSFGGSGCSASSNGIKVTGAGTYMIWASAYMTTGYTDNDIIHFVIYKNSTAMYEHQERTTNANPYKTVQIGPTFFDLAANDVVYLYAYNQASARGVIYSKSMTGLYLRQIA